MILFFVAFSGAVWIIWVQPKRSNHLRKREIVTLTHTSFFLLKTVSLKILKGSSVLYEYSLIKYWLDNKH